MLVEDIERIVGAKAIKTSAHDVEPHVTEWRGQVFGKTPAVVQPATTAEVSAVLRYCNDRGVPVVPQGGNTGLCAGAVPDESGEQIVLSLSRLNRIRSVNADDFSMVAEAGCVLADLQAAAQRAGRVFPLSLGAEGTCQIGGNISTNAGGINVLRYGTARDQVLGLEVVRADGSVWDGLKTLRKNTAGYDLKQLFVGSEGTLGIVTAASLKLYPEAADTQTAMIAMDDAEQAIPLLAAMRRGLADQILAFELISDVALGFVIEHIDDARRPFDAVWPWYVLVETSAADGTLVEQVLMEAFEAGLAADVVVAGSQAQAESLWRLRHSISAAEKLEAPILKHDISVPIAAMPDFLKRSRAALKENWPDAVLVAFGHVGDGNLHYNVKVPGSWPEDRAMVECEQITQMVYELAADLGGSFSAEHGVGSTKRGVLERFAEPEALEMMRAIKKALDPNGILNPGKVI